MTNEDYDRKKLAYEKGLEIRYRQVEFGYQMFNFFLAGMSFMVLAFATILASASASELHAASRGIALLGIALSVIFAIMGFLTTETIRKYDLYLLEVEDDSGVPKGPFKAILKAFSDLSVIPTLKKRAAGVLRFIPTLKRLAAGVFKFRLSMSWCIPTIFIFFWLSMSVIFWN